VGRDQLAHLGRNRFPARIVFETQDDYLPFIGRMGEFTAFAAAVGRISAHLAGAGSGRGGESPQD
jgi:hypothetical protein